MINDYHKNCPVCGQKMIKKGKQKDGKQKWYCHRCKKYHSFSRKDLKDKANFNMYIDYSVNGHNHEFFDMPKSTFFRNIKPFRGLKIKALPKLDDHCDYLHLDAIYKQREYCHLIAKDSKHTVAYKECKNENAKSWGEFIKDIPAPKYVVCDGQKGLIKAIKLYWPNTIIQICLFHVNLTCKHKLTLHPKTTPGQELKIIANAITKIKTMEQAEEWIDTLYNFEAKYKDYINEKTISPNKRWQYTHRRLRSCVRYLKRLHERGQLFCFLLEDKFRLPKTNNSIEGGTNSVIRKKCRSHPGMNKENYRQLIKLVILSQSKYYNSPRLGDIFET